MSQVAPVHADLRLEGLRPADQTVSFRAYLISLWERRDYIWHVAQGQLRSQQMNTVLGNVWHLLNPMLQIGVYFLIFGLVLGVDRGVDNFTAFLAIGLFSFQFSQRSTMAGARSIASNQNLIRSIWFPRALLPTTSTLQELMAYGPVMIVMFAVCLATREQPRLSWLLVPALVALQAIFNLGVAMVVGRWANFFPDIQQLLPFIFRLLMYASGVIFLVDAYVEQHRWRLLFELNPFYSFVSLYRWAILGFDINEHTVLVAPIATVIALGFGFWWFRRAEREYGRG